MNMTCTNRVIKQTMFVFNFIFVITGIIILAVGASVKAKYYPYNTFLDDKYFSLPNMLIATGSLIFFISFLGCYGAMRENWVLLMIDTEDKPVYSTKARIIHNGLQLFVRQRPTESNLQTINPSETETHEMETTQTENEMADEPYYTIEHPQNEINVNNDHSDDTEIWKAPRESPTTDTAQSSNATPTMKSRKRKISTRVSEQPTPKDSFDIFGEYVAATLRQFPSHTAAKAEMALIGVLHAKKLQVLEQATKQHPVYKDVENRASRSSSRISSYTASEDSDNCATESSLHEFLTR